MKRTDFFRIIPSIMPWLKPRIPQWTAIRRLLSGTQPTGLLFNWVYSSKCRIRDVSDKDLEQILDAARRHNLRDGLTGLLLFVDGTFIQAIEGQEAAVVSARERILRDHRHSHVHTLHEGPIPARNFPHWSMGYATPGADAVQAHGLAELLDVETTLPPEADINDLSVRAVKLLNAFVAGRSH